MLRSFQQLAREPDAPLKPQAANARDVVAWLQAALVKPFLADVAGWFARRHAVLMKQGLGDTGGGSAA